MKTFHEILCFIFRGLQSAFSVLGGVHKLRLQEEGGRWSKKKFFCKLLYHKKCKRRGVGGQKKPNFVNVVCERPLSIRATGTYVDVRAGPHHIKSNCDGLSIAPN